jgi:6-phosphofructokinase
LCELQNNDMKLDVFGHTMLGETALFLSDMVGKQTGMKSRGIVFSTLQRCASHIVSRRDITEAYDAGAAAVTASLSGETGKMTVFRRICDEPYKILTETRNISDIANIEKTFPTEWITNNGTYVSKEFINYARPLIIGELTPFMVDGLPRHLSIKQG